MSKKQSCFIGLISVFLVMSIILSSVDSLKHASAGELTPVAYLPIIIKPFTYDTFKDRSLWESSVDGDIQVEDFEKDFADWGVLAFPFETGNGFILTGESSAQILEDQNLSSSGNLLHFRDWEEGLTFWFPENTPVQAFSFDYRASEKWYLTFNDVETIELPPSRPSFVGIVFSSDYPVKFVLWSDAYAQGGLTVDNISYLPVEIP